MAVISCPSMRMVLGGRLGEPVKTTQQAAFAAAAGAEQADNLAGGDGQADVVEDGTAVACQ